MMRTCTIAVTAMGKTIYIYIFVTRRKSFFNLIINMEPTNELITKSEAYAEGFSVVPNNECMTKAEFVANLPTPPPFLI